MNIHFIAIGGAAMHNLALAIRQKGDNVTGSDDEIFDPAKSRLDQAGLLPTQMGWFPEKINKDLDAVIVGMHAREDNPELLRAKDLGIRIYSYPEFLYQQAQNKIRVVIGGSHGKTTVTSMILHVLNVLKKQVDYMVGAQIEGFDTMVRFSEEARIAVFEGDEYLTSPIDPRPKFHLYRPHIAVVTGIAWDHINVFPTFEQYVLQFKIFAEQIERDGKFIYFANDPHLKSIANNLRPDLTAMPYEAHPAQVENGQTRLITHNKTEVTIPVFGQHNLQNIQAAHLVCKQLGIKDADFYKAISSFKGAAKRLQTLSESADCVVFQDFAHAPSKLKATVSAVKEQFPERKLIACMELHTFSSLNAAFLPEYAGSMDAADVAYVYYNPKTIEHKQLERIEKEAVVAAFQRKDLHVFTDSASLMQALRSLHYKESNLLMMSSGNFDGTDLQSLANEITQSTC